MLDGVKMGESICNHLSGDKTAMQPFCQNMTLTVIDSV